MELKPGFKQTEVGIIPEDWQAIPLALVTTEIGDGIHSTPIYDASGQYYFINGNNLSKGRVKIFEETKQVGYEEFRRHRSNIGVQTILLSINGTIGNLALFCGEPVVLGKSAAYLNVKLSYSRDYIYSVLQTPVVKRQFADGLTGTTIFNLGLGSIRRTIIPSPSTLDEQQAIATALSDTDALIESLEQLLTKKRQIKQGAMQELLTGKRRLPGFKGEWVCRAFGDLLTIRHGKSQFKVQVEDGEYPILATGGEIGRSNSFLCNKPSVLIGRKGTIDRPQYMQTPFWSVDTLFYSDVHEPNCAKYIFYRFCMVDWRRHNEASGVPSLNARTIESLEVLMPEADEQAAIASLLSEFDAEITALETRLLKTRQLKQGMMQELLTGRIRLLNPEACNVG